MAALLVACISPAFMEGLSALCELASFISCGSAMAKDSSCPKNKFLIELRILI
jgi:hypothetical protein